MEPTAPAQRGVGWTDDTTADPFVPRYGVSKADLIAALCRHGSMATQEDVDAFVEVSDALGEGADPLDVGDVVALLGALDAGDDHPEVRWTVLHLIESQEG
jgi:hypothetical protein